MTAREKLDQVLAALPGERLCEVLDFARFLLWIEKQEEDERKAG